jgi:adenine-specific DNA-methyltransferase
MQQPPKLDTDSKDIMSENLEKLKELFPSVIKDGTVDVEALKNVIGDISEPNQEYYNFTWAGKSDAFKIIKEKSKATLKPLKSDDESVDFENTQNIFIEGDNLEVLKILQKTYHNAIKMIYIDPPYNKDKDFVYPDKWSEGLDSYLEYAKLVDEDGNITSSSAQEQSVKQGRKHSRWLTMMYPRLFLARNLLKDDGVIFISIDDDEVKNLRNICDEIFGEENELATVCVKMSHLSGVKMSHKEKKLPKVKEFIVAYAKNKEFLKINPIYIEDKWENVFDRYDYFVEKDERINPKEWNVYNLNQYIKEKGIKDINLNKFRLENADKIFRTARNKSFANFPSNSYFEKITTSTGLKKYIYKQEEVLFASNKLQMVNNKLVPAQILGDIWTDIGINNLHNEGNISFENGKKPLKLIKRLINMLLTENEIILDFFAGSGTTAHAVMALNAEDGGNRKSISVQLPEHLDKKNQKEAIDFLESISKPTNIAEITKERIRRAGNSIIEQNPDTTIDTGFKVFKLSESNFKKWDENIQTKEQLKESLDLFANNVKDGADSLDMLYEVILSKGLSLNSTIDEVTIGDKSMYKVNSDGVELLACFEDEITKTALDEVVSVRPIYFICLDSSFKNDTSLKTNSVLNFKDADILFETV